MFKQTCSLKLSNGGTIERKGPFHLNALDRRTQNNRNYPTKPSRRFLQWWNCGEKGQTVSVPEEMCFCQKIGTVHLWFFALYRLRKFANFCFQYYQIFPESCTQKCRSPKTQFRTKNKSRYRDYKQKFKKKKNNYCNNVLF